MFDKPISELSDADAQFVSHLMYIGANSPQFLAATTGPKRSVSDQLRVGEQLISSGFADHFGGLDNKALRRLNVKMARASAKMSTEQSTDQITQGILDATRRRIDVNVATSLADIPVRTTWTGALNALTTPLPSGRPIILLDYGAIWVTKALAYGLLGGAFDEVDRKGGDEWEESGMLLSLVMLRHCLEYLRTDNVESLKRTQEIYSLFLGRFDTSLRATSLSMEFVVFVLLHELGHVALGHLAAGGKYGWSQIGDERISTLTPGHDKEYAADSFAAGYVPNRRSTAYLALIFSVLSHVRNESDSHPSWSSRWASVREKLVDAESDDVESFVRDGSGLCKAADEIGRHPDFASIRPGNAGRFRHLLLSVDLSGR